MSNEPLRITTKEIIDLTGFSRTTLWRKERDEGFPKATVGKGMYSRAEVYRWLDEKGMISHQQNETTVKVNGNDDDLAYAQQVTGETELKLIASALSRLHREMRNDLTLSQLETQRHKTRAEQATKIIHRFKVLLGSILDFPELPKE